MENKEEEKVQIKLEKYRWPDEIARERQRSRSRVLTVGALVLMLVIGYAFHGLVNGQAMQNDDLSRFREVYQDVVNQWFFTSDFENPQSDFVDNAIKGMLDLNGDPHTSYMTKQEMESFQQSINLNFDGIGVQYFPGDNANIITKVFKGSPAEQAGVEAGDSIYKVNGILTSDMGDEPLDQVIKGESGSVVTIEVMRGSKAMEFAITRGKISALTWGRLVNPNVGYIEISSFGNNLAETVIPYLDSFKDQGAQKLILDLRNNGGGYLKAVQDLAPLFFEKGSVVFQETYANGKTINYSVDQSFSDRYQWDDIVILINEGSASAAEVFALALTENLGVKTVGVTSYGKGTIQASHEYRDGSSLKITTGKWNSPSGVNVHGEGIKPDFEVRLDDIFYDTYPVLEETLKPDSVDPAIAFVQEGLKYLGFHQGRMDGYYDVSTRDALMKFKKSIGASEDDSIDAEAVKQVYASVMRDWAINKSDRDIQLHKALEVLGYGR